MGLLDLLCSEHRRQRGAEAMLALVEAGVIHPLDPSVAVGISDCQVQLVMRRVSRLEGGLDWPDD